MSTRIGKRRKKRYQQFKEMAVTTPYRFIAEWTLKLASWSGEVRKWVEQLNVKQANDVIEYALKELEYCGPAAIQLAGKHTKQTLIDTRNNAMETLSQKTGTELWDIWTRNIRWMCRQATIRAKSLDQPRAFAIVSEAGQELKAFGPDVWHRLVVAIKKINDRDGVLTGETEWEQVFSYTKAQLEDACAKAVSKAYDVRMYRL